MVPDESIILENELDFESPLLKIVQLSILSSRSGSIRDGI